MRRLDWYFDFVSPFSYFQTQRFAEFESDFEIVCRPILFAALLTHWGQLGPAEIPPKRRFTYRYLQWYAEHHQIAFKMPAGHPFNPLRALRLAIALGSTRDVVLEIFEFIWAEGQLIEEPQAWRSLIARLGASRADALIAAPEVKGSLRENTARAVARGVFGVPTFAVDDELFWGVDATDMLFDYLTHPERFQRGEMARVSHLPIVSERRVDGR